MFSLKNFFKKLLWRITKTGLFLGLLGLVGFGIWSEASYRNGLTFLPSLSEPTSDRYSQTFIDAQWLALGGQGSIPEAQTFHTHSIIRIGYELLQQPVPKPQTSKDKLTNQSARILLARHKKEGRKRWDTQAKWKQVLASTTLWVEQNWSVKQRINTVLSESWNGTGCNGIQETAQALLGKKHSRLSLEETALLVSITTLPFSYMKRERKIRDRTNTLIAKMALYNPKRYASAKPFARLPYTMIDLKRAKQACRS